MALSRRSDIESYLPVKPVVLQILLALHGTEAHGYAVIQSVREHSGGLVRLSNGAFYRHLAWLLKHGLVAEAEQRPQDADPRRGIHYRLTELGADVLAAEGGRMREVVAAMEARGVQPEVGGPGERIA